MWGVIISKLLDLAIYIVGHEVVSGMVTQKGIDAANAAADAAEREKFGSK